MWCFAKVNGKLAEVYFKEKRRKNEIYTHCFVDSKDYKTKKEQSWIDKDTKKFNFLFKNNKYIDLNVGQIASPPKADRNDILEIKN